MTEPAEPATNAASNTRLDRLTLDIERHAAAGGWDQPPHLFALVETADLLRREPQLAAEPGLVPAEPGSLTPVDQGELPEHASLDGFFLAIEAEDSKFDREKTRAFLQELGATDVNDIDP